MPTITRAPLSGVSILPPGLRVARRRLPTAAIAASVVAAGLLVASAAEGASPSATAATLALIATVSVAVFRPGLALGILVLTIPFNFVMAGPAPVPLTALEMVVLLIGLLLRRHVLRMGHWQPIGTPIQRGIAFLAGATLLSMLGGGGHLNHELTGLAQAAGGFLVALTAIQSVESAVDRWVAVGCVVAAVLLEAIAVTVPILAGAVQLSEGTRAAGSLLDPNHFAGLLVLVLPLVLALGVTLGEPALAATVLASVVMAIALLATLSRGGWLGLLGGAIVLFVLLPAKRKRILALGSVTLMIFLALGFATPVINRLSPHATGSFEMLASRWRVWTAAISMISQHPIVGVGVGNFQYFYVATRPVSALHAHNLFLNIAAERGLIGLAAFGLVLVALFRGLLRELTCILPPIERALVTGLIASFAGYLVHSLFDTSYVDTQVLLMFWLLVGLAATVGVLVAKTNTEMNPTVHDVGAAVR